MSVTGDQKNPLTRPGFIAAAVVIAVVLVLGLGVLIGTFTNKNEDHGHDSATGSTQGTQANDDADHQGAGDKNAGGDSVCGLGGEVIEEKTLSKAPKAEWKYMDIVAYPTSKEYGPGKTADEGYVYCFQRSPEGAVFAASNVISHSMAPADIKNPWIEYIVAESPYRESFIAESLEDSDDEGTSDTRLDIQGYRLLSYDGNRARVDIGIRGVSGGQTVYMSNLCDLVWENGDWKLEVSGDGEALRSAVVPNLSGYVDWRHDTNG